MHMYMLFVLFCFIRVLASVDSADHYDTDCCLWYSHWSIVTLLLQDGKWPSVCVCVCVCAGADQGGWGGLLPPWI